MFPTADIVSFPRTENRCADFFNVGDCYLHNHPFFYFQKIVDYIQKVWYT